MIRCKTISTPCSSLQHCLLAKGTVNQDRHAPVMPYDALSLGYPETQDYRIITVVCFCSLCAVMYLSFSSPRYCSVWSWSVIMLTHLCSIKVSTYLHTHTHMRMRAYVHFALYKDTAEYIPECSPQNTYHNTLLPRIHTTMFSSEYIP